MGISALLASQILDASATGRSVLTGADASAIRSTLGLGTLATQSATITDYLTIASAASTYQPLDSDLTSIAALSTTAFGRGLLTEASATTARSTLGLGTLATQSPTGTPSASTFLRGDLSWQTIDLSGYLTLTGGTMTGDITFSSGKGITSSNWTRVSGSNQPTRGLAVRDGAISFASNLGGLYWSTTLDPTANQSGIGLVTNGTSTLEQQSGTTAQTFRVYNTFTDASNYERAKIAWESNVLRIGTEKAGTGSARALELQTDGVTRLTITTAGRVELGTIAASANAPLRIQVDGAGRGFVISNSAAEYTEFVSGGVVKGLLCSGSVPFAVWNAGDIYFQCNNIEVLRCTSTGITASQNITLSTKNLVTDTTTGTKIGTATTQKLGFFNATPVVQPTAVADATDAASVITQLNALLSRMRDLGLIAT